MRRDEGFVSRFGFGQTGEVGGTNERYCGTWNSKHSNRRAEAMHMCYGKIVPIVNVAMTSSARAIDDVFATLIWI